MTHIMVRHDAPLEVTVKAGRKVLSREIVEARLLDAHITVQSYMRGGAFNGHDWRDNEGNRLSRPPTVTYHLADPSYALAEGEECPCDGPEHQ